MRSGSLIQIKVVSDPMVCIRAPHLGHSLGQADVKLCYAKVKFAENTVCMCVAKCAHQRAQDKGEKGDNFLVVQPSES